MFTVNKSLVDQFTLVHGAAGVVARRTGVSFGVTVAAGFLWDYVIEPELKRSHPGAFPFPSQDAPDHAFIDAITPAVAWLAYDWYLRGKK